MLDPEMLEDCCPLDNGRHDGDNDSPRLLVYTIGALDILPREIFQDILVNRLDLTTLTLLRRVSRGFRHAVDTLPHYQTIVSHGPAGLRGALSLEVASASFFTCRSLYNALCVKHCFL
jgi:hypothetical protein